MAEATLKQGGGDGGGPGSSGPPAVIAPLVRGWRGISPSLVPVLAVITALIITIPLMIVTRADGDIGEGLEIAQVAYAALIEGSIGLAMDANVEADDVSTILQLANAEAETGTQLTQRDLLDLSRQSELLVSVGRTSINRFDQLLDDYENVPISTVDGGSLTLDDEGVDVLGEYVTIINEIGAERLQELAPLITQINEAGEQPVRRLADEFELVTDPLTEAQRASIIALAPLAADYSDDDLLYLMQQVRDLRVATREGASEGITRLMIALAQLETLDAIDLSPTSDDALLLSSLFLVGTERTPGVEIVRELLAFDARLQAAGITNAAQLLNELRFTNELYSENVISNPDIINALENQLPRQIEDSLVVHRPGNRVLFYEETNPLPLAFPFTGTIIPPGLVALTVNAEVTNADVIESERINTEQVPVRVLDSAYLPITGSVRGLFPASLMPRDDALNSYTTVEREITQETRSSVEPETVYLRLGGRTIMFFPSSLESTLVRSIPYVVAGLAVSVGFMAGLFNIGAEGQLYAGSLVAAWVGFSDPSEVVPVMLTFMGIGIGLIAVSFVFRRKHTSSALRMILVLAVVTVVALGTVFLISLAGQVITPNSAFNPALHIAMVLISGLIGGGFWGFIPGILKAYTGAHEVINTIMLNFIAIRLTDWLIKSTDPVILRDLSASAPRTAFLWESARLPAFDTIFTPLILVAGIITAAGMIIWKLSRSENGFNPIRAIIQPLALVSLIIVMGYFLVWITVSSTLHVGFIVMIAAVWFVTWFLERTTPGFEVRTVGANPEAARYAGMSVGGNLIIAMTMSGALAGLAGILVISGVEYNMEPEFFAGLGFDAIAVALLARNSPRAMIPAGLLWGALLTGAGLMQVNANISINLVQIIQALIIMFIAADAIIRRVWQIPEATAEEKAAAQFSKGWGG